MKIACLGMALAAMTWSGAMAQQRTFHLRTNEPELSKWTVYEITNGEIVSAPAVFNHRHTWGHVPSITIPFTNCDGYWYTKRDFHIPVGATNLSLNIIGLGVDDRAVLILNHVKITSVGTQAKGEGDMQFRDPGQNKPYDFQFIGGTVSFTDTTDLKPGHNELEVIVNNTGSGIYGTIQPIGPQSPSSFGIDATVSYTE
jgi:hypothetical protein